MSDLADVTNLFKRGFRVARKNDEIGCVLRPVSENLFHLNMSFRYHSSLNNHLPEKIHFSHASSKDNNLQGSTSPTNPRCGSLSSPNPSLPMFISPQLMPRPSPIAPCSANDVS